ncbi:hypothetical protein [Streptomyces acidiscabies]|uniref:hypothetical protein n=1 Tax=Streptomyces acidiscabies TaxID=42234 RepID=UPI0038F7AC64
MTTVTVRAPAKVNLTLSVGPRRPDGYHELGTVFLAVGLHDTLRITSAPRLTVTVAGPGAADVPAGDDNLATRAAALVGCDALRSSPDVLSGVRSSPRPVPCAAPPYRGKATSLPSSAASSRSFPWVFAVSSEGLSTPAVKDANDLQDAALSLRPELARTLRLGMEHGALTGLVSGSGPTCAFLAESGAAARDLASALSGTGRFREVLVAAGPVEGCTAVVD